MDYLKNIEDGLTASGLSFTAIGQNQDCSLSPFIMAIQNLSKEAFQLINGDRDICNKALGQLITANLTAKQVASNFGFSKEVEVLAVKYTVRTDDFLNTYEGKGSHERTMDYVFGGDEYGLMPLDVLLNNTHLSTLALIDATLKSLAENNDKNTINALIPLFTILALNGSHKSLSSNSRKAAKSKYAKANEDLLHWYRVNKNKFESRAEAARNAKDVVNLTERVIYKQITDYEKNVEIFGESYYWNIHRHLD